jgi:adenylate kinase family enzyme
VNVIGTSGSGKTTFGRQLAGFLNIPFIEMDAIFWGPNWQPSEDEDFFPRLTEALQGEHWVLDGNYSRTTDIKMERVEVVIWLDFSFPRTLWQAIVRATGRLFSQEELWPGTGNRESLRMLFSKDSIVLWTITSYARRRKNIIEMMGDPRYQPIRFHRLRSPAETAGFLTAVHRNSRVLYKEAAELDQVR